MATASADFDKLRFPIGKYQKANEYNPTIINSWIDDIEKLTADLQRTVTDLTDEQFDTQYRPDGWTVRQVVHHLADSHINAYIRFKLALTEDKPVIKPYKEDLWATLPDSKLPVSVSVSLLTAIHQRWVCILKAMNTGDFDRTFFHPESKRDVTLKETLGLYAWHGKHHLAHITTLKENRGW